ncbi:FHA domain-containing protein [Tenacibaculum sp.]|nr:FHA domain-containing protein [Tenacibaculum sp.]
MAIVENTIKNKRFILYSHHTIGRDRNNISLIDDSDVSRKHAIIYWENSCWQLTDSSSNGTKINSCVINRDTKKLKVNDLVQFSNSLNNVWKVINLAEPSSFFKAIDNNIEAITLDNEGLFIEENGNKLTIFKNIEQKWILDNEEEEIRLINGKNYLINGLYYEFIENEYLSKTVLNIDITKNACFKLRISGDEESITSKIKINELEIDLGNRVFNHLLLCLVRKKQHDLNFGLNNELCGWIDMDDINNILSKELLKEIDSYYINTLIYRLRKNLMNLPPYGFLFANIIERKKGKLRFGLPKFEIEKEQLFV